MSAFLKLLFRNRLAAMGAVVLGAILLLVLVTPLLPLPDPNVTDTSQRFLRPFEVAGHLLGTDHLGRDLLAERQSLRCVELCLGRRRLKPAAQLLGRGQVHFIKSSVFWNFGGV